MYFSYLIAPSVKWSCSYNKKRLLEDVEQMDHANPAVADDKESQNDENAAPRTQQSAARKEILQLQHQRAKPQPITPAMIIRNQKNQVPSVVVEEDSVYH
jgi:hypothetical protein